MTRSTPVWGVTTAPVAKGSTALATLTFVEHVAGTDAVERVLGRLDPETRASVRGATPTAELPFAVLRQLLRATDAELGPTDPRWAERAGAFSIQRVGVQLYGGILRKPSPADFLTQGVSLFRLYYHPGDMEVVEHVGTRVVLRLVGFEHDEPLFCQRQTGGLLQALTIAGGVAPTARHVRCAAEGDAFCEWELSWREG